MKELNTFYPCEFFDIADEKTTNKKYQQKVFTSESVTLEELEEWLKKMLENEKKIVKAVCHNYLKHELSEERLQSVVIFHLENYTRNLVDAFQLSETEKEARE